MEVVNHIEHQFWVRIIKNRSYFTYFGGSAIERDPFPSENRWARGKVTSAVLRHSTNEWDGPYLMCFSLAGDVEFQ